VASEPKQQTVEVTKTKKQVKYCCSAFNCFILFYSLYFSLLLSSASLGIKRKAETPPPVSSFEVALPAKATEDNLEEEDDDFEDINIVDTFETVDHEEDNEFYDLQDQEEYYENEDEDLEPYKNDSNKQLVVSPTASVEREPPEDIADLMNRSLKISGSSAPSSSAKNPPSRRSTRVIPKIEGNFYIDTFNLDDDEPGVYTWFDDSMNSLVGIELHLPSCSCESDFRLQLVEHRGTHFLIIKSKVNNVFLHPNTFLALLPNQDDPMNTLRKSSRTIHFKDMVQKYSGDPADPNCKNAINKLKVIKLPFLVDDIFDPNVTTYKGTYVEFCQMELNGAHSLLKLDIVMVKRDKVVKEMKNTPQKRAGVNAQTYSLDDFD
jgi:hypothetical protein